jgi:hypothetical protein
MFSLATLEADTIYRAYARVGKQQLEPIGYSKRAHYADKGVKGYTSAIFQACNRAARNTRFFSDLALIPILAETNLFESPA